MKPVGNKNQKHYALTERSSDIYQLYFAEELLLESDQVVVLAEVYQDRAYPDVIYFPQSSLAALELSKSEKNSFCPIKGYASYWNYRDMENCIWSYQDPLAEVIQIKGHYAFDQSQGFRVVSKD
jgi:uncharacterized protein (DUF427 family)